MALTEFRYPYEALIRYDKGLPVGIQLICEEGIERDGVVTYRSETPAEPIEVDGFALTELIGKTTADALKLVTLYGARIDALTAELAQHVETINGMGEAYEALQAQKTALEVQVSTLVTLNGGPIDS